MFRSVSPALVGLLVASAACGVSERVPGDRTPLTSACDPLDGHRCHLPWPSNAFTVADDSTRTGLRLAVDTSQVAVADRPDYLNIGDGFSRITGVAAGFSQAIDAGALSWDPADSLSPDSVVQVIHITDGASDFGARVAYRTEQRVDEGVDTVSTLLIGRPVQVLAPEADYAFVVLDSIGVGATANVRAALGLDEPSSPKQRQLAAHYAPTAAALEAAGVDLDRVARFSEFTTRSHADTTRRMHHMIDVLDTSLGALAVEIDSVTPLAAEEVDAIVRGRLTGAPSFLDDDGRLVLDDDGLPTVTGTASIEFRMTIPAGDSDYRLVLYGHGTGGDVTDNAFDRELAGRGISKLNLRWDGWTGDDFLATLLGFNTFLEGSERSTAGLMQSISGGTVLLSSLDGVLGEALSADTLGGEPNVAAGRRPMTDEVAWVGGSMGGTMGAVLVAAEPRLNTAVLNVPGAGWSHMVPYSLLYEIGMNGVLENTYGSQVDVQLALIMGQGCWDDVDGAVWADEALDRGGAFLMQQSMGDPVLPNLGTELLANALHAEQLDPALSDIHGLDHATRAVTAGAALTQFRVPDTGQYDVHGFAARNTPAGHAALGQITTFLEAAWAGEPIMAHPVGCAVTQDGSCDFSGMWE
jgi:hypothetical protein